MNSTLYCSLSLAVLWICDINGDDTASEKLLWREKGTKMKQRKIIFVIVIEKKINFS